MDMGGREVEFIDECAASEGLEVRCKEKRLRFCERVSRTGEHLEEKPALMPRGSSVLVPGRQVLLGRFVELILPTRRRRPSLLSLVSLPQS